MIRYPASVWLYLALAGVLQPFAMEAYNLASWYWPDPGWVRVVSLTGPFTVICALSLRPINAHGLWRQRILANDYSTVDQAFASALSDVNRSDGLGALALLLAGVLWAFPWSLVGIEANWSYRSALLALQVQMAVMWWLAIRQERASWLLEVWSRRVGFTFACLGIIPCVVFQFLIPETAFLDELPIYDVRRETASAMVHATGLSSSIWALPLASLGTIILLAAGDGYRRERRRNRAVARVGMAA